MADNVHISAFVPLQLREALEREAVRHDRSLSAELRQALRAYTSDRLGAVSPLPSGSAPEREEP